MSILWIVVCVCLIIFGAYMVQRFINPPWKHPVLVAIVVLTLVWIVWLLFPGMTTARIR